MDKHDASIIDYFATYCMNTDCNCITILCQWDCHHHQWWAVSSPTTHSAVTRFT